MVSFECFWTQLLLSEASPLFLNPLVMYEKRFLQCCALKRCFFDAALKTRSLIIYPSERQERTEDGSMAGPQKMVRGSAKCKSKGVPWNTNIASTVCILHLSFSFLRNKWLGIPQGGRNIASDFIFIPKLVSEVT